MDGWMDGWIEGALTVYPFCGRGRPMFGETNTDVLERDTRFGSVEAGEQFNNQLLVWCDIRKALSLKFKDSKLVSRLCAATIQCSNPCLSSIMSYVKFGVSFVTFCFCVWPWPQPPVNPSNFSQSVMNGQDPVIEVFHHIFLPNLDIR